MFTIAIIGRPNVGKSTLFNRMARKRLAIVDDTPGVTRDWREAEGWLLDVPVRIIDTAGLEESFDDSIQGRMRRQTEAAVSQADAILFIIDGRTGLTPMDEHFAQWLRRQEKPVVLAVNKCDHERVAEESLADAYALGMGDPVQLSAAHGHGMEMLYDAFAPLMKPEDTEEENADSENGPAASLPDSALDDIEGDENYEFVDTEIEEIKSIKIAIAGRPNVGKSTLLNAILQDERVMTGPEAGITRDAIAVDWEFNGRKLRLVDTAGLRKKAKSGDKIEKMAGEDTMRAIRLAQIVILVIDANAILEKQDLQIAQHIIEEGRALILAVNKWDAVDDRKEAMEIVKDKLTRSLAQLKDVPVITMSALRGTNIRKLLETVLATYELWNRRVPTSRMNRWLQAQYDRHPPPLSQGRPNRLRYITQIKARPPTFVMWVSRPADLPDSYKRYIVNGLAGDFGIEGVPIRLLVRTSKNPYV